MCVHVCVGFFVCGFFLCVVFFCVWVVLVCVGYCVCACAYMCVCVSSLLAVHSDPGAVILGGRRAHPSQTRGHRVHRQYPPVRTGEGVGTGDWEGMTCRDQVKGSNQRVRLCEVDVHSSSDA